MICFMLKMNNLHDSPTSHRIEYYEEYSEDFFVLQLRSVCVAFHDASFKNKFRFQKNFPVSQSCYYV